MRVHAAGQGSVRARRAGLVAIVATAVLWGTTGTAATWSDAGPLAIGAGALGLGGLGQAAVALPALRRARPALAARRGAVALGAVAVAVYPLAFYASMHLAGVAVGTTVSLCSAPLVAGVLERMVDGRRLGRRWWSAALLGIAGAAALVAAGPAAGGSEGDRAVGISLGLVAGTAYAAYSWMARRLMADGIERAAAMGAVFGGGGLLLMPVLAATGAPLVATGQDVAVWAYMAVVPMFLGYLLFGFGLARVTASTATTVTLIEPAVATLLAIAVVGERLSAQGWTGMAALGLCLAILADAPVPRRARTRA